MAPGKHRRKKSLLSRSSPFVGLVLLVSLLATGGYQLYTHRGEDQPRAATAAVAPLPEAPRWASETATSASLCSPFTTADVACAVRYGVSDSVPVGQLMRQSPPAGTPSTTVVLLYSKGPAHPTVPILTGLTSEAAARTLWENGLQVGKTTTVDAPFPRGQVVKSSLVPGTRTSNGKRVDLTISSGMVRVPNWVGKPQELVTAEAKELGLSVTYEEHESTGPTGVVLSQSTMGKRVAYDEAVKVIISKPLESSGGVVPDVVGMKQTEAISLLAAKGFLKIVTQEVKSDRPAHEVVAMTPEAGSTADSSASIHLTISAG